MSNKKITEYTQEIGTSEGFTFGVNYEGKARLFPKGQHKGNVHIEDGDVLVDQSVEIGGDLEVEGNLVVKEDSIIQQDLQVTKDIQVGRDLSITRNASVSGNLTLANISNFRNHIEVYSKSQVYTKEEVNATKIPSGFIYFQLKGQLSPESMFGGDWTDISSLFAGLFFRVEGGEANAFGGDNQGDAIRNITGSINHIQSERSYQNNEPTGAFTVTNYASLSDGGNGNDRGVKIFFDASREVPIANENRPVNTTIIVWRKD